MSGALDVMVSCFPNAFATDGRARRTVNEVLDDIQDGTHQTAIASLRRHLMSGDRDNYDSQKRGLPAVTFAGAFTRRGNDGLDVPTGLAHYDIDFEKHPDHLQEAEALRDQLARDPLIAFTFVSPSGAGVKCAIRIPIVKDDAEYKINWQEGARYLNTTYRNVTVEKGTNDIARLCFFSYDPGLHRNPDALLFSGYRIARLLHTLAGKLWAMRDGERDQKRNDVAHTVGGLIAGGQIEEAYALAYFEPIVRATTQHPDRQWRKFSQSQMSRGKKRPIKPTRLSIGYPQQAAAASTAPSTANPKEQTLKVTRLSTVKPERVDFLWKPYLPIGRPVALEGDPGVGKSSLVAKIIAHITTGRALPNVVEGTAPPSDFTPRNVCLLTSEDDPADTIRPRIEANDGDPSRVYLIDGWEHPDGEQGIVTLRDLTLLKKAIDTYQPALIVFDPLQSFFGRSVDMNKANDTRPVLDAVSLLCREHECTPFYVWHVGKMRREAIHAGIGSIDIIANMRSALFLGVDPDNPSRRIIGHSKSNNAARGQSLAYLVKTLLFDIVTDDGEKVEVEAPKVLWDGLSRLTADDLSSPPMIDDEEKPALDQAREFLTELLETPVLYTKVQEAAKQAGISWATIKRAKPLVGVKARRQQESGKKLLECPYEWYIPDNLNIGGPPNGTSQMSHQGHQEQVVENRGDINSPLVSHVSHQETPTDVQENQSLSIGVLGGSSEVYQGVEQPKNGSEIRKFCDRCGYESPWVVSPRKTDVMICVTCSREEPAGVPF